MSSQNVYDFGPALEDPIAEILTAEGLKTVTPRNYAKFQEVRPRAEIEFELGEQKNSFHVLTNGEVRNATWFGSLNVTLITNSGDNGADGLTPDSSAAHRAYRAQIQNVFAVLKQRLNSTRADASRYLPFHEIQRINQTSNNLQYKAAEGNETSKIVFNLEFGIRMFAWDDQLNNSQAYPATTVP